MNSYFYATNGIEVCRHEHQTLGEARRCAATGWPLWSVYMVYTDHQGRRLKVEVDVDEEWLEDDTEVEDLIGG